MKKMNNKQKFLMIVIIFIMGIAFGLSALSLWNFSNEHYKIECRHCSTLDIRSDSCYSNRIYDEKTSTKGNCSRYGIYMLGMDISFISVLIALTITGLSFLVLVNLIVISELKRMGYFKRTVVK